VADAAERACFKTLSDNRRFGSDIKRSLGLVDIALAISMWDWDGIMPGLVMVSP
jgi:hypothetical protein